MQYKLFANPEIVEVKTPVTVKKALGTKDFIMIGIGVLLLVMIVMWYLSSQRAERLEKELIETQLLIVEQEAKTEIIRERSRTTDFNIRAVEERRTENKENEKTITNNPVSLDVRAAQEFLTEYEPITTDTTSRNR